MKFVPNFFSGTQFFVIIRKNLNLNTKYLYYLFYQLIIYVNPLLYQTST